MEKNRIYDNILNFIIKSNKSHEQDPWTVKISRSTEIKNRCLIELSYIKYKIVKWNKFLSTRVCTNFLARPTGLLKRRRQDRRQPRKTPIQCLGETMFGVKSVNLLCALLNTSTSHSRHKIPLCLSGIHTKVVRYSLSQWLCECSCVWCASEKQVSLSLEAAAGAGARKHAAGEREKGWTGWIWRPRMHAEGGGVGWSSRSHVVKPDPSPAALLQPLTGLPCLCSALFYSALIIIPAINTAHVRPTTKNMRGALRSCLSLTRSLFRARWDEKIGLECLIPC